MAMDRTLANTLVLSMVLGCSAALMDTSVPNSREPVVNVAVVFSSSSYSLHIRNRLTYQTFLDMPLEVHPVTVVVNDTNPSTLLTQICDMLSSTKIHGIVFEDNIGTEAVAQILDFISSQTYVPIVSISGGSAVVLTPKVKFHCYSGKLSWNGAVDYSQIPHMYSFIYLLSHFSTRPFRIYILLT